MAQSIVAFVVLLGVLITVHELGHFLIAKALNVKVLRFSVGFGPKIVGFTRGETEYRIAWIPLGGYVKMAGELPYDELAPEEASRGFLAQPPWKRALIVIGGPLFNLVFPILIYFFAFVQPQQMDSTRVRYVYEGLPAAEAGIQPGDQITAVDGQPVATFASLVDKVEDRAGQPTRLTVDRNGQSLQLTVAPAETFEVGDLESSTRGSLGISPRAPMAVLGVSPGSPAYQAGLRHLDRVLSVNGKPVTDVYTLGQAVLGAQGPVAVKVLRFEPLHLPGIPRVANPQVVSLQVPVQPGTGFAALGAEPPDLFLGRVFENSAADQAGLKEGDRLVAVNGKKLASFDAFRAAVAAAAGQPFELQWRHGLELHQASLQVKGFDRIVDGQKIPVPPSVGVASSLSLSAGQEADTVTVHLGVMGALKASADKLVGDIRMVGIILGRLVTRQLSLDTMGGPLAIYQLAGKASALGMEHFLGLMGLISVNLGIMNLLPIPVLDGFALLSAIWEGIRRRPIPNRAREIANMIGLAVLIVLMVRVMINDIGRF